MSDRSEKDRAPQMAAAPPAGTAAAPLPDPPPAATAPRASATRVAQVLAGDLSFRALCAVEAQRGTDPIYVVEAAQDHTRVTFLPGVHQATARQLGQAADIALGRAGFATALDLAHPPTVRVVGG